MANGNLEVIRIYMPLLHAVMVRQRFLRWTPAIVWNEAENFPYADRNPYVGPAADCRRSFLSIGHRMG